MRAAALTACLSLAMAPALAGDFSLGLPIDCEIGTTCRIQQYVDRDPGPGYTDFACGRLSYDGHKGTDFALPTLQDIERGVAVLASADGVVAGRRDGMADTYYTDAQAEALDGRDCGNGVLLRHEDGWETQYCHLRQGSVRVQTGDRVARGDILGLVGLSGRTQFPHVHLSVRRGGAVIDPFAPDRLEGCGDAGATLWDAEIATDPGGLILAGFAPGIPEYDAVRAGEARHDTLPTTAPGLVLFAHAFGGRDGDRIALRITDPDGDTVFDDTQVLEKDQALLFRAGGKRLRGAGWTPGLYTGTARMTRNGTLLGTRTATVEID
ncbi:MAG TPA: peptidase M24 [Rhodobacteraceae bacterium]|nr:peptidase M24 [Paracoccaceae bacterium]